MLSKIYVLCYNIATFGDNGGFFKYVGGWLNMDKKNKILVILDVIGLILSIVGVFFLTIMFKIDNSIFRYMFLLGDLIIFVIFSSCLNDLELDLRKNVKKYSMVNIDRNYMKKLNSNKIKLFFKF